MKIYFAGSIRGGRSDVDLYADLIDLLEEHGTVLTEHVADEDVEESEAEAGLTDADIYEQDMAWLREADVAVAEVTIPSLGVGYEIGRLVARGTPVCGLYRPDADHELSAMIRGNDAVDVLEYESLPGVAAQLEEFLRSHR
ncbi:nucleoside 2-deoxyribosyltransferase [Halobiforma nitratireducens]|uniref:Putative 2'-deoxynucleoside 5'-phosphate N-hydrolase 1 n=1 Tax=Halobiforma nitratireducens JCM 10879 TaxID=1227454 RepID=M0M5P2_9EURY|nr:nucleoside 2-deoxyribosyltransferase [Halobiforma nitratireducens]EMA41127.1 nucleoside 2-deoxyribosyltransferase [Halobiforma nitratireducens JCM 10879]